MTDNKYPAYGDQAPTAPVYGGQQPPPPAYGAAPGDQGYTYDYNQGNQAYGYPNPGQTYPGDGQSYNTYAQGPGMSVIFSNYFVSRK